MSRIEAADWSKFQPRHTSANMLALKNAGIGLIIPGAWHGDAHGINPRCKDDLRLAREAGLHTATYTVLDSPQGTTAAGAVQKARQVCGEEWEHLSFVAVDVEVTGITIPEIATALTEVERMGQRPIIYTAYWFWHDRFGNPDNFKDVPLWNAYYDKDPDFDFAHLPYGGWTVDDVVGTQYEGTTTFAGVEMDRNSFLREFVENGEDMATDEQLENRAKADAIFATAAAHVRQGRTPPKTVRDSIQWLLGLWNA